MLQEISSNETSNDSEEDEVVMSFDWSNILIRFEAAFRRTFVSSKKAHFDCLPSEFKIIDGAKMKWCHLVLIDALIYYLQFDTFNLSTRRAFNQQKALYEAIMEELSSTANTSNQSTEQNTIKSRNPDAMKVYFIPNYTQNTTIARDAAVSVVNIEAPWTSLEALNSKLRENPTTKSRAKYLACLSMLFSHHTLIELDYNMQSVLKVVVFKAINVFSKRELFMNEGLKSGLPLPVTFVRGLSNQHVLRAHVAEASHLKVLTDNPAEYGPQLSCTPCVDTQSAEERNNMDSNDGNSQADTSLSNEDAEYRYQLSALIDATDMATLAAHFAFSPRESKVRQNVTSSATQKKNQQRAAEANVVIGGSPSACDRKRRRDRSPSSSSSRLSSGMSVASSHEAQPSREMMSVLQRDALVNDSSGERAGQLALVARDLKRVRYCNGAETTHSHQSIFHPSHLSADLPALPPTLPSQQHVQSSACPQDIADHDHTASELDCVFACASASSSVRAAGPSQLAMQPHYYSGSESAPYSVEEAEEEDRFWEDVQGLLGATCAAASFDAVDAGDCLSEESGAATRVVTATESLHIGTESAHWGLQSNSGGAPSNPIQQHQCVTTAGFGNRADKANSRSGAKEKKPRKPIAVRKPRDMKIKGKSRLPNQMCQVSAPRPSTMDKKRVSNQQLFSRFALVSLDVHRTMLNGSRGTEQLWKAAKFAESNKSRDSVSSTGTVASTTKTADDCLNSSGSNRHQSDTCAELEQELLMNSAFDPPCPPVDHIFSHSESQLSACDAARNEDGRNLHASSNRRTASEDTADSYTGSYSGSEVLSEDIGCSRATYELKRIERDMFPSDASSSFSESEVGVCTTTYPHHSRSAEATGLR